MVAERLSRTQRDLQRLDGRRGPKSSKAVTWGDLDELLAEIATRSQASKGKLATAIGVGTGDGTVDVGDINAPVIEAPTGLTITSTVDEKTGIAYIYVDWDDVAGSTGYQLGFTLDGGNEFTVAAPRSFFQNSVIGGTTISVRVRSVNALGVPGAWSLPVNHVAQPDNTPPPVPGNVTIEAAFNGFWFKWDKSSAIDISRYEVYESASSSPAPTALTNPTFTSASPLFFRGAVGNGIRRYYWIRAVDRSENASDWSTRVDARTLRLDEDDLGDNVIVARHLTTGELITLTAQIKNAIITDAKIADLSADKLKANTAIANSITVNGQALGTIEDRASNPAARINAASTNILPGKITLTGSATLLDWTASADRTQIDGGKIYTNSIEATSIDTSDLAADTAFITSLASKSLFAEVLTSRAAFIDNLEVREASIDTLQLAGNAATAASVGFTQNTKEGTGFTLKTATQMNDAKSVGIAGVTIPKRVTAKILVLMSLSHGYSGDSTWAFQIERTYDNSTTTIVQRTFPMSAMNDYPTVAYLDTIQADFNDALSAFYQGFWYGKDNKITLRPNSTIAIFAGWR